MPKSVVIEGPEDMNKELEFDKFMDEILINESKKKVESENIDEHRVKKLIKENTDISSNRVRFNKR